jgi:hypothetical protein
MRELFSSTLWLRALVASALLGMVWSSPVRSPHPFRTALSHRIVPTFLKFKRNFAPRPTSSSEHTLPAQPSLTASFSSEGDEDSSDVHLGGNLLGAQLDGGRPSPFHRLFRTLNSSRGVRVRLRC